MAAVRHAIAALALLAGCGAPDEAARIGPGRWAAMSTTGAPMPRAMHVAVWSGSELIVWGGHAPGHRDILLGDGARYDPVADAWRPMTREGAPAARYLASGTWTGRELIVFGGETDYFYATRVGEGVAYDPVADRWRRLPADDAPSPRSAHVAVWTGSEVVIWGGIDAAGLLRRGARYRPAEDRWLPVALEGAPAPRRFACAAWHRGQVYVLGGVDGALPAGDAPGGGRYDPAADAWTPLPEPGMPQLSAFETVVSAGEHLVVLSSSSPPAVLSGDAWRTLADGPPRRFGKAAVFTGRLVWLFGGGVLDERAGTESASGDGALLDPGTGQWHELSLDGAPSARKYVDAQWTGSEVLIWGGGDDANVLATGGRWRPAQ